MTICLATTHYAPQPGGIAHYYTCLSKLLSEAGHTVILLTIADNEQETEDQITWDGDSIRVSLANDYRRYKTLYSGYFRPGSYGADAWLATGMAMRDWLIRHAGEYKIDLIEVMDFGGAGIFLKQSGLPPLIIDAHSSALQISQQAPMVQDDHLSVIKQLETLAFRYADAIIAHSPMNLQALQSMGFQQTVFSRAPWLLPGKSIPERTNTQRKKYLVISSLQPIKGAELMIQAAAAAAKKDPEICIYWAGDDSFSAPGGKLASTYLSKKYPGTWSTHFRWLGQKNKTELNELMNESAAVIIPSLWDTFNYVVPETVMAAVPLILSDKTGAGYLVKDHPMVISFSAGNAIELAEIIVRQHFSQPAGNFIDLHQKLEDYFSADHIVEERMKIYEQVIRKKQSPDMKPIKEQLRFLDAYIRPARKNYYQLRKVIKRIIRPFSIY